MPTLVIGNKRHSSWSLRPWLLMRTFGIPFEEVLIPFGPTMDDPAWKARVAEFSPAGKVPVLVDGEVVVWDSLAIIDHVADTNPDIWTAARTRFGQGGPFLFGAFTAADAMYAPVVTRFETYSIPVDPLCRAYMDAIMSLPAFREWRESAWAEPWLVPEDEVDEEPIQVFGQGM